MSIIQIPLFDAHCDTIYAAEKTGQRLFKNTLHTDLSRGARFSPYGQVFAIWAEPAASSKPGLAAAATDSDTLYLNYRRLASNLRREFNENSGLVSLCLSARDARLAAKVGKIAAFISVEGAELLKCSLDCLWEAFENGVRIVNITHNRDNPLSGAAMGAEKGGLTEKGKAFSRFAQSLGIALDVSHISETAFWDLAEIAQKPIFASHSCSGAMCAHARNLSDSQFETIKKTGGTVGVSLVPDFLGGSRDCAAVYEHIEHFLALGGEKTLTLGADFDGTDELPPEIRGIEDMAVIYEGLLRRNHSESLVRNIFYNNFLEALEKML